MSSYPDYISIIKFIFGSVACLIAIPIALAVMSIASRS